MVNRRLIKTIETDKTIKGDEWFGVVLDKMLAEVESVEYETCTTSEVCEETIRNSRNELVDGGFGDNETEDADDFDVNLLDSFFSTTGKKNYHLSMNSEVVADTQYEGEIHGIACEETEKYYVFAKGNGDENTYTSHGLIVSNKHFLKLLNPEVEIVGYDYFGTYMNDGWIFYRTDKERSHITFTEFDMVTRLFSRNTGLLESSVMGNKTALIVGCGSVGSLIALELARAGVGAFILVDSDTLEIHNICRHQLGFRDLGRYKVDAVADAIRNINPNAKVQTFRGILQELPTEMLDGLKDGIVIGTGDNRESNAVANELAKVLQVPFVTTGCWQRAHAGECFYWCPDKNMPLYRDAFSGLITDERPSSHQNYFADEEGENNLNFEPGVSTDIEFVTLVAVKIIYDLLNRDSDEYTTRVLNYLRNYTLVCNTNEPMIGGKNAEMFPHPLFISNTISVGGYKEAM